jgi:hypothetical protein
LLRRGECTGRHADAAGWHARRPSRGQHIEHLPQQDCLL